MISIRHIALADAHHHTLVTVIIQIEHYGCHTSYGCAPDDAQTGGIPDSERFYYTVDVKTHRLSTKFNMPNQTSVERLARYYEDDRNVFVLLMVAYDVEGMRAKVETVTFVPIGFLGWDCLTIGALGWGQIQIANSNRITVNPGYSRKRGMLELCDILFDFYPKEIEKIQERLDYFRRVRTRWEGRDE